MPTERSIIDFEPHGRRTKSEGKVDGVTVAVITKMKNHTHTNTGIYSVQVLGEELEERFREIEDARDAARSAYAAARSSPTLTDATIASVMGAVGPRPFHTAHFVQALAATRREVWDQLIARYGKGGRGAGTHYSAHSAVAHALDRAASRGVLDKLPEYADAPADLHWGSPVIRYWTGPGGFQDRPYPDELSPEEVHLEGAVDEVKVNRYERNMAARAACLSHYGARCQGCGMDFVARYGERGRDFMHVHHLLPLKNIRKEYRVDPILHLRPVCPNCHAMIHRREPMLSIEQLQAIVR